MRVCEESLNGHVAVSICCLVYNHEKYLRQCLDGFVMQKTDFRFEAVIHDDASTDNSADIIREYADKYPDIIRPIFESQNQYSKKDGSLRKIMNKACQGKYVAMCEGDDYWTDPYKLQKQFAFLEKHQDYFMCFHSASVLNEANAPVYICCNNIEEREYFTKDIFPKWIVPTASVVVKREVLERPILYGEMLLYEDIAIFLSAADCGRIWGMSEQMSVYRINSGGVTQKSAVDYRKWLLHEKCLRMNFPKIDRKMINNHISSYYYSLAKNNKSFWGKLCDYLGSFFNSPLFFMAKISEVIKRRISFSKTHG